MTNNKKISPTLYYSIILGVLYILPIILSNRYYNDDTQRVLYHFPGWTADGRPLTELVMKLFCGVNNYIYDIFPLPLLLSVLFLMIASVKWTNKYYESNMIIGIIASFLPISMSLFLTNLSYRFDCISMVLSVVFIMLPFLVECKTLWMQSILDTICLLISMCFYQPTIGLYIGLVVIAFFIKITREEKTLHYLLTSCLSIVLSGLLYKFIIARIFVDKEGWRAEAGRIVSLSSAPEKIYSKYSAIVTLLTDYARSLGARQVLIYIFIWMLSAFSLFFIVKEKTPIRKSMIILFYIFLPSIVFFLSLLPLTILDNSTASSRYLSSLISMMFVLSLCLVIVAQKWPRIAYIMGFLIVLLRLSFSYAYGNSLRVEKEYADQLAINIVQDIEEVNDIDIDEIGIIGDMPYSPIVENTITLMPIMKDMIPTGIDNDGMLNGALINHHSFIPLNFTDVSSDDIKYIQSIEPARKNTVYCLYINKRKAIVCFNDH